MDVSVLIEPKLDLARLAEVLDGLGHEGRVHATRTWTKKTLAALFDAAKSFRPIDLDFLVPPSVGALVPVVHDGHNSLVAFNQFQKHFVKLEGEEIAMAGHNVHSMEAFTGPGYFAVEKGQGEHEGEVVFDYTKVPKHKPAAWPEIRPNEGLIPGIVNGGMVDYVRALSSHVAVGVAYKHGHPRHAWFAIVRKDAD